MTKAKVNKFDYKILLLKNGDPNDVIDLTKYLNSHSSSQQVELENDRFSLEFNLNYTYRDILGQNVLAHQFVDSNGEIIFKKNDIAKVFVKQNGVVDISTKEDLLAQYFIKDFKLSLQNKSMEVNFTNINAKIYNRIWSRSYGIVHAGDSTNISSTVLTDSGASFATNALVNKTLNLIDITGKEYNYLILSNTSTTVTVHRTIDGSVLVSYKIGDSSPTVLFEALKAVTPTINFNGLYNLKVDYAQNDGGKGINLIRTDNFAFPIIDYSQNRKPYHKLIAELGSSNAINTEYELNEDLKLYIRDMVFDVDYDTEEDIYAINWYYPKPVTKNSSDVVVSLTNNSITNAGGMTIDELKGKILRVNNRSYNILSNTVDTLVISTDSLLLVVNVADTYIIYDDVDFIWDSTEDYTKILDAQLSNQTESDITHIYFNCGTNRLNNREITGHLLKDGATTIVETSIPMTYIAKDVLRKDKRLQTDGTYAYPTYPHIISNELNEPLTGAIVVTTDGEYNSNFRTICRKVAFIRCETVFSNTTQGSLTGTFKVVGNKYLTAGLATNVSKTYHKGTQIMYKDIGNGFVNPEQVDGYYILKVDKINHSIRTDGWDTIISVSYDAYGTIELNEKLI